ncbi:hypothetical protein N7448_010167 [Penicillium atrosanguineum]|uniref:Cyanovirin-N domain-containing protein n=1 Tax=Penicillium atrosanguineum TaxID=1132637 RepID=A0A9W9KTY1_9EURO|nr:uncharacterized protein N7443_007389 [Penicillium atrosanguineum]KAJ5118460.1 hypothetical protein N7526_010097 [Penicillium atrosanguineum]KAJ5119498.1 hypothetical protein N7448_010167 [Penicillium atrosanguineum]KAJ5296496.1 hypothetical protein N7443_007389 [Penicillium atrosanguineum]KAJ5299263.1 hypothetical protein N7476_010820 [Penicillium atrosanguineum]
MFNKSACDAHLKLDHSPGSTYLIAICNNEEGAGVEDDILLDKHIGNKDDSSHSTLGHFDWNSSGFSTGARNISLSTEGPEHTPILHSELRDSSGHFISNDLNLATHIANIDGKLVYKDEEMS